MHDWPRIDFCAEAVDGSIAISGGRNWWTGERLSDVWLSRGHLLAVDLEEVTGQRYTGQRSQWTWAEVSSSIECKAVQNFSPTCLPSRLCV